MIHSNVHIFSLHTMHSTLSPQKYLKSALLALITTLRNSFVNYIQTRTLEENISRPVVPDLKSLLVSRDPTPPFGDLYEFELPRWDFSNDTSTTFLALVIPKLQITPYIRTHPCDVYDLYVFELVLPRSFQRSLEHLHSTSSSWV